MNKMNSALDNIFSNYKTGSLYNIFTFFIINEVARDNNDDTVYGSLRNPTGNL